MSIPSKVTDYMSQHETDFVRRLQEAVGIPSVSGDPASRPHVMEMAEWIKNELTTLGATVTLKDLGKQTLEGKEIQLPPAILASVGSDASKPTVLIYAHYDVQPAAKEDGWDTDPFKLTYDKDRDCYHGRGSTDDKGPLVGWINVLDAHVNTGTKLPVNIKFCLEGMEESGSVGLDKLIVEESQPGKFLNGVACVCISDNYWLNTSTPCLTYGLRGISCFELTISGPKWDLHSGVFGGTVYEPMTDLIALMSKLVTSQGKILVPGVYKSVPPVTEDEKKLYDALHYSIDDIDTAAGANIALSDDKVTVLMGRMREPSLSLHGIEGAFSGPGTKTVIPPSVTGKFSIRLVPNQTTKEIEELVEAYVTAEFEKLNSKSTMKIEHSESGEPWYTDPNHWNFKAAERATLAVYDKKPDYTREGGSIPIALSFSDALHVSVVLLPMGRGDDGAHSEKEKIDRSNYLKGTQLLGTYLWEVAKEVSKDVK
ncbi:Zn-dependent exopeptidase [Exidia glandulosa HHB12029]|uniref:Zn-dependent exopeptidase n=1 Tax=Exidia glandulosa HHB12029 TaxID=1314781 RepID=A0A165ER13_EXIGL|nr:Zn-dependent exopeptidase [Exidia glandulosa HHB12029]